MGDELGETSMFRKGVDTVDNKISTYFIDGDCPCLRCQSFSGSIAVHCNLECRFKEESFLKGALIKESLCHENHLIGYCYKPMRNIQLNDAEFEIAYSTL